MTVRDLVIAILAKFSWRGGCKEPNHAGMDKKKTEIKRAIQYRIY